MTKAKLSTSIAHIFPADDAKGFVIEWQAPDGSKDRSGRVYPSRLVAENLARLVGAKEVVQEHNT